MTQLLLGNSAVPQATKPNPAAIAVQLGLRLRPIAGAAYAFDGETITYNLSQPLALQRREIARACVVHLLHAHLRTAPMVSITEAALKLFDVE